MISTYSGQMISNLLLRTLFPSSQTYGGLKPRSGRAAVASRASSQEQLSTEQPRPARCKDMFAELSNYLDEQLDDSLCEELERHLNGCEPCKAFLSSLKATIEQCRRSPAEPPDCEKAIELRKKVLADFERMIVKNIRP